MLPLYPPYAFLDLAKEHLGNHRRHIRRHHPDDLDQTSVTLPGRRAAASGLIAPLSAWISRKLAGPGHRSVGTQGHPLIGASNVTELMILLHAPGDEHNEQRPAA